MSPPNKDKGVDDDDREFKRDAQDFAADTAASIWAGFPVPFSFVRRRVENMVRRWKMKPEVMRDRSDLYRKGAALLAGSRRTVTTVSTIRDEEFPSRPGKSLADPHIRDYYISLHRVAYMSRLDGERVKLLRYADVLDPDKCQEAISLLYYGSGVEIIPSTVPVEFLSVDGQSILIGFGGSDRLFGGFIVSDPELSKAMSGWIRSHGNPDREAIKSPIALAEYVKSQGRDHGPSCLCNIVAELGDEKPSRNHSAGFDEVSTWYYDLYAQVTAGHFYEPLANAIRKKLREPERKLTFLDIGCATGFGALELTKSGFGYWGLDSSARMLGKAPKDQGPRFCECDAIGALMGVDPQAKRFYRERSRTFDVIACQGNTFDYLLGPVQKALALFLFDATLPPGGLLLFTGADLTNPTPLPGQGQSSKTKRRIGLADVEYEMWPLGEYQRLVVTSPRGSTTFVRHPCSLPWLRGFLKQMDYAEVDLGIEWFAPGEHSEPYKLTAFQKRPGKNREEE